MTCWPVRKVDVHGCQLAVVLEGQGLPILFVHGFPLDHSMWDHQIEALSKEFLVIAPDLPGFGASGPLNVEVQRMEDFADSLSELLTVLGIRDRVVFCGLSMGGYIAWQFWRRHADRLRALILCDTRAAADTPEVAQQRITNAERVLKEGPEFFVEMMISRLFSPRQLAENSPVVDRIRQVMRGTSPQTIAACLRGMAQRVDARAWLGEISLPTLVVVGEEDALSTPAEMEEIAAAIPGAKFVKIPGAGHLAPLENPSAVNQAILQFLRDLG